MASSASDLKPRISRPRHFRKDRCQASGCSTDLKSLPWYNRRNHICTEHKVVPSFIRLGQRVRFCQRCGVAHPIEEFDGDKRSCRKLLQKHNARRRKGQALAAGANTTTEASTADDQGPSPRNAHNSPHMPFLLELSDSIPGDPDLPMMVPDQDRELELLAAADAPMPADGEWAAPVGMQRVASATASNEWVCCSSDECVCCENERTELPAESAGPSRPAGGADGAETHPPTHRNDLPYAGHAAVGNHNDPYANATSASLSEASSTAQSAMNTPSDAVYAALVQGHLLHAQMLLAASRLTLQTLPVVHHRHRSVF